MFRVVCMKHKRQLQGKLMLFANREGNDRFEFVFDTSEMWCATEDTCSNRWYVIDESGLPVHQSISDEKDKAAFTKVNPFQMWHVNLNISR